MNTKKIISILAIAAILIFFVALNILDKQQHHGLEIAKVNGKTVYQGDLQNFVDAFLKGKTSVNVMDFPPEQIKAILEQYGVEQKILAEAKNSPIKKDPAIKKRVEEFKKSIIKEAYLNLVANKNITETEIKARYEKKLPELKNNISGQKEYRASHILVKTKEEAEAAAKRVNNTNFAEIANEVSIDSVSKVNGGDLGYFSLEMMIPKFSEQIKNLNINEISKPFQTNFGWHIVLLQDSRNKAIPSIEELQEQIKQELYIENLEAYVDELKTEVTVEMLN